jgi:hypothetical protein
MNFHNFSIFPLIMKICGHCPGTSRILRKILFLLFDTFQYEFLIMQKLALLACGFCVGSSYS